MGLLEKPITTQEELDALMGERAKRATEATAKKYEGWISPDAQSKATKEAQQQIDELNRQLSEQAKKHAEADKQLEALQAQNHKYETDSVKRKVAYELGLDQGLAERLNGETEDDIRKDAESLKSLVKSKDAPPLMTYEADKGVQNTAAAWNKVLAQMRGE